MKKFIWNNETYQYEVKYDVGEFSEIVSTIIYKGTKLVPKWDLIFWKSKELKEVPVKIIEINGCNIEWEYRSKEEIRKILDKYLGAVKRKEEIQNNQLI